MKPKGWRGQSGRHRLAAKGIKTGRKSYRAHPVTGKVTSKEAKELLFELTKPERLKKRKENYGVWKVEDVEKIGLTLEDYEEMKKLRDKNKKKMKDLEKKGLIKNFGMGYFENPKERRHMVKDLEAKEKMSRGGYFGLEGFQTEQKLKARLNGSIIALTNMGLIDKKESKEARNKVIREEDVNFDKIVKQRFGKPEKTKNFGSHPKPKGTIWHTTKYIHGPRVMHPSQFIRIRVSKEKWPKKELTQARIKKLKSYARKHKLKLPQDFPKSTKSKIGPTKKEGFKVQSYMTPVNRGNWIGLGPMTEREKRIRKRKPEYREAKIDLIKAQKTGNLIKEIAAKEKMKKLEKKFRLDS